MDIPPTHGDIPMVFNQFYKLPIHLHRVKYRLFGVLPIGVNFKVYLKYGRCRYIYLYCFLNPDSLPMHNTFNMRFHNQLAIFQFYQQFHVSMNQHCRADDFEDEIWLANFGNSGNTREMVSSNTLPASHNI